MYIWKGYKNIDSISDNYFSVYFENIIVTHFYYIGPAGNINYMDRALITQTENYI